jgi:multiple sugar transport system ATP-binding protein
MATVKFKNVEKIYPNEDSKKNKVDLKISEEGIHAVQDFNLEIKDKEFVVLVGPSGCGKSTTLRMVAGLEEITKGEIYIDDILVNDIEPKDRDISMVFQNYALYPHMTVKENMEFPLKMRKISKEKINQKVYEAAETLGITDLLKRKPRALSGGQRQRVAIGRAIVREPKVLLMDEPLSNLDAKLRNQMRSEIIKLRQRIDTTFIYVTHDQIEAMTLGDRIVIMKLGVIQQVGTPNEVYYNPKNLFVAGFIGTPQMNFYSGELIKEKDNYYVIIEKAKIALSKEKCDNLRRNNVDSRKVTIGIRPQHITFAKESEEYFEGRIDIAEMMGSETYLHISVADNNFIVVVPESEDVYKRMYKSGEEIKLTFSGNLVHVFNPETEENLEYIK